MSDKNFDCKSQRTIRLNGGVSGMQERAREDIGGGVYESERERKRKEEKDRKGVQTEKQDMIRELEEICSRSFLFLVLRFVKAHF